MCTRSLKKACPAVAGTTRSVKRKAKKIVHMSPLPARASTLLAPFKIPLTRNAIISLQFRVHNSVHANCSAVVCRVVDEIATIIDQRLLDFGSGWRADVDAGGHIGGDGQQRSGSQVGIAAVIARVAVGIKCVRVTANGGPAVSTEGRWIAGGIRVAKAIIVVENLQLFDFGFEKMGNRKDTCPSGLPATIVRRVGRCMARTDLEGVCNWRCVGAQLAAADAATKTRQAAAAVRSPCAVTQDINDPGEGLRAATVILAEKRPAGLAAVGWLGLDKSAVIRHQHAFGFKSRNENKFADQVQQLDVFKIHKVHKLAAVFSRSGERRKETSIDT